MEGLKPPVHQIHDEEYLEDRFTNLCKTGLSLDENATAQAIKLFNESKHLLLTNMSAFGSETPKEVERNWFAMVLYSVKRLCDCSKNTGFNLFQILRITEVNIVDFFKELPHFVLKVGMILSNMYGSDWEKKFEAKELQANFVHLSLLNKYYKEAFQQFFVTNVVNSDKQSEKSEEMSSAAEYMSHYYRFGWLLFLALRIHAFSSFKDLVTCTNGLISVLAILIIHSPIRFRKFTTHDTERFVRKSDKGVDLLASLCNIYNTSEDDLKETVEKVNNLVVNILKKKPCAASECRTVNLESIDPDGLIYFEDLMEELSLSSSIDILEKDYDEAMHNQGEFDERIFCNEEDSLLGSGSLSAGSGNLYSAKRKNDWMTSPTKITSPISSHCCLHTFQANSNLVGPNSKISPTPVSTAMTTAKWLRTIISPLPSKPLPELDFFLSSCDNDISIDVIHRAHLILEAIFPSNPLQSANLMDNIWAEQRRMEALKLYYRVLESMCRAEAQILHANNLTSLLTNERFHRCMLACSAELVLATHKAVTMLFPAVLERTSITAFDLSKVIESFIRHEESLPRELKRHLNSLEERLLESMVWETGSSMYNSLIVARPSLSKEINRLGLIAEPIPTLDAIAVNISYGGLHSTPLPNHDVLLGQSGNYRSPKRACSDYRSVLVERNSFTSPVKDRLLAFNNLRPKIPPLQSAFASPTRPNPGGGGETCAETGISIFLNKIIKLAAVRISGMVERLQLSQQVRESVYALVQQILSQRTTLFFNRHVDQIILCCLYGVAKISQMSLTFREIILTYRKQPHCKPQVFRNVFVDWSSAHHNGKTGKEHVDIITFYNEIFIPAAKPLLVELGPAGTDKNSSRIQEGHNNNDGQCPESPKISPFPSIPDMSPRKVSATRNVYVSPLRSSKMDALISHGSKSYYACVGESTHAYQSPSKDLTAINSQLNGGSRKLRGVLKFEDDDVGLVSDSMVAKSLCIQNGKNGGAPLKIEHQDPQ